MNFDQILENLELGLIDTEFEYLEKTIEKLINSYLQNFQEEDDKFKQAIDELRQSGEYNELLEPDHSKDITYGQMMEYQLSEPFNDLENFSSIIIESLLIKHLAYIERFLVKLSFLVQKKEKQIIPPNQNISGVFTDMLKAVEYINLVTQGGIKVKETKSWKIIKLLRTLRHQLAHGERSFILKEGVVEDINREISIVKKGSKVLNNSSLGLAQAAYEASQQVITPKTEWHCTIGDDINILKELNKICMDFIKDVKELFHKKYSS